MAEINFSDGTAVIDLDVRWIHGSSAPKYNTDPDIQVHRAEEHTYILRQNMAVSYEAPFLFLLFGRSKAVLIDTGATENPAYFPLRATVDDIVRTWLADHPRPEPYELLVLHTHSHGDHTAGDGQFVDRPQTTVIGAKRDAAWPYFGFDADPDRVVQLDLGGRRRLPGRLDVPARRNTAGTHHAASRRDPTDTTRARQQTRPLRAPPGHRVPGRVNA